MNKLYLLLAVFTFSTLISYGQNCNCDAALKQDLISSKISENDFLNYLNIIDEESFNEIKHNGGLGIKFPIGDIPIGIDANYDDFNNWRTKKFTQTNFTSSKNTSVEYFQKITSERGYQSFDNCINRCLNKNGLFISVINSTEKDITLEITYKPAPTANGTLIPVKIADEKVVMEGTTLSKLFKQNEQLSPNSTITKIITRPKNKTINGYINAGGYSANYRIERYSKYIAPITILAKDFSKTESKNICDACLKEQPANIPAYGDGVITNNGEVFQDNIAIYNITIPEDGDYQIDIQYAAAEQRKVTISVGSNIITSDACSNITGGWKLINQKTEVAINNIYIKKGLQKIKLYRNGPFPHIKEIILTKIN